MASNNADNSPSSNIAFTGGCQCGSVRYTSTSPPQNLTYCYCITCRRLSGSSFIAWADIPSSSLQLLPVSSKDSESPSTNCALKPLSSPIATRSVCKGCGSSVTMMYHCDGANIGIAAGTIDEDSLEGRVMQVTEHIFLGQKPGWHAISEDGVKRWERFPDGFEKKLQEWEKAEG